MEFGYGQGLAVNLGYDQDLNNLRYRQEYEKRTKDAAVARAKMSADEADFQNAMNPYDSVLVKEDTKKILADVGRYRQENSDSDWNPDKRIIIKEMLNGIKTNPNLIRGMQVDTGYKELLKDYQEAQKNPQAWDIDALNSEKKKFDNYFQTGHYNGQEGFNKEGPQAAVYIRPEPFIDLGKKGQDIGNRFKDMQRVDIKNGRDGAWELAPKPATLRAQAEQYYNEHKRQFDKFYTQRGIDPVAKAAEFIDSGIERKFDIGNKNTLNEDLYKIKFKHDLEKSEATGASPYKITVLSPGYAKPPAEQLAATFGSKLPYEITNGKETIPDDGDDFHFDPKGGIYDKGFRKDGRYPKTGIKVVDGYILKPLDWGKEHREATRDPWGLGEVEIRPEWKDVMSIVDSPMDKDGKTHKMIRINVRSEVNANDPTYEGRYNKEILTSKQREGVGVNESQLEQNYEGHPVGSILKTTKGDYLVTPNGYIPQ